MSLFREFDTLRNTVDALMSNFDAGLRTGRGGVGGALPGLGMGLDEDLLLDPFSVTHVMGTPLLTGGVGKGGADEAKLEEGQGAKGGQAGSTALSSTGSLPGTLMPTFNPNKILRCRVNVEDAPDKYAVSAELPGFDKENLKVNVTDDGILQIRGEQSKEWQQQSKDKKYLRAERAFCNVQRNLKLPHNIDTSKISAQYINGVLHIDVPKTAEQEKQSHIQIK